jgi:hypothetical protein
MSRHDWRLQGFVAVLLFAGGFTAALWIAVPDSRAADANAARINALLNDRLTTLKQIATAVRAQQQSGLVTPNQMYAANQAVNGAELDMAQTEQQRITVLDRMLAEAKSYESLSHSPAAVAIDQNAPLRAKAARLDVEIALERERLAAGAPAAGRPGANPRTRPTVPQIGP